VIVKEFFYNEINPTKLFVSKGELSQRLSVSKEYTSKELTQYENELKSIIAPKYSGVRVNVSYPYENAVDLGFSPFESQSLYKNLKLCKEAYIFTVTLGIETDRFLKQLSVTSIAKHFLCDALCSAFAEAAADYTETEIKKENICHPRFSIGYGDLSLELQPDILELTNAKKLLNITLSNQLLMTPTKTITAIMGIESRNSV